MFGRARVEALSDAVFAIALTLLVLELRPPRDGAFPDMLLDEWPVYVAYLTAFLTIAMIWVNHHAVFARVGRVDPTTMLLNFGLLLGTSLVPWPAALISAAIRSGEPGDRTASVVVYAVITVIVAAPWALLNRRLAGRPDLLVSPDATAWLRRNSRVALLSIVPAAAGAALAFLSPIAALLLFLVLLIVSLITNVRSSAATPPDASGAGPRPARAEEGG